MNPFFNRLGNKYPIRNEILKIIPEHNTYVEPLVGSGAILFSKEPSQEEVINDLDDGLIEGFRLLKEANENVNDYNTLNTIESIQQLVNKTNVSKEDQLLQRLYISSNTFSSKGTGKIYQNKSGMLKIKKIGFYKERLKDVKIYNTDYKEIIEKYDSDDTFFFLDPPYEKSNKCLYKNHIFDLIELNDILLKIKGKFILTLNDSHNVRDIFKDFNIEEILVKAVLGKCDIGGKIRKELIITNFIKIK